MNGRRCMPCHLLRDLVAIEVCPRCLDVSSIKALFLCQLRRGLGPRFAALTWATAPRALGIYTRNHPHLATELGVLRGLGTRAGRLGSVAAGDNFRVGSRRCEYE